MKRRDVFGVERRVVLGDGAVWIWNFVDEHVIGELHKHADHCGEVTRNITDFQSNRARMDAPGSGPKACASPPAWSREHANQSSLTA